MPTYEYVCRDCQHRWELEQKITEPAVVHCPRCQRPTAQRLISEQTSFVLHGERWAKKQGY